MTSEIENAAQDPTESGEEFDEEWDQAVPENKTGTNRLSALVYNAINDAKEEMGKKIVSKEEVIQWIVTDMKSDKGDFNFILEDLRYHFRKVANLFGCEVSEVQEEFARLLHDPQPEEIFQWKKPKKKENKKKHKPRSIVKSPNYRKKNLPIQFPEDAVFDDLVFKEVNLAERLLYREENKIWTERRIVIDRILKNMYDDNFSMSNLKDYHFRKVVKFYTCASESQVEEEFFRQNNEGLVFEEKEEVDAYLLAKNVCKIKESKKPYLSRKEVIRLFFRNLEVFGLNVSDQDCFVWIELDKYWHREEVLEEFHKWTKEFEEIRKEDIMDILVRQNIRTSSYGNRGIPRKSLTKNKFFARLRQKIEERDLTVSHLKQRHFEEISKFSKCDVSEVMEDLFGAPETPEWENGAENYIPPPQFHGSWEPELAQNQDDFDEEPVPKRAKYDPESEFDESEEDPESEFDESEEDPVSEFDGSEDDSESGIQEVDYDDFEPEEEVYQMEDDEEHMDYEEAQDPEFQDSNLPGGGGDPWESEDGSPATSESKDPEHEEMEDGTEYQEDPEFQDPGADEPSWDHEDDVPAPEDEKPAPPESEDPEPEVMEVEQEEEPQVPMSDEEILMQVYIDMICDFAVSNENTSFEFKKKTLLRELFNFLVDDNLSADLSEKQFEKIATSFDADQDHIEELFAFFEREKKFLDNLDRGVFEDPRITEIINNIMGEVVPSIGNPEDENFLSERLEILESFYKITVKNGIEIRMISRQKRHLAAYLGLSVTETMDHLMEWELRDRPKNAPAPNKKVREPKANRVSLAIAKEELFFGSISELEPGETVADREAAVKCANSREKKRKAKNDPRLKMYFDNYQEKLKNNKYEYDRRSGKVTDLFRQANGHISKRMSHPVQEAYRTAFLILLYKEIARELTKDEVTGIGKWMKMKDHVDYIRRKEKQFFETGTIKMDDV